MLKPIGARFSWLIVMFGLVAVSSAQAQSRGDSGSRAATVENPTKLTASEAVERTLSRSDLQQLSQAEVEAARAGINDARMWTNPVVHYDREVSYESPSIREDFILVEQEISGLGQRGLRANSARESADAQGFRNADRRAEYAAETRRRYYDAMLARQKLTALREWIGRLEDARQTVRQRVEAGESSKSELAHVERELDAAELEQTRFGSRLERLRMRLAALAVPKSAGGVRTEGELLPGEAPAGDASTISSDHPGLRALSRDARAAELQRRAAGRWWIPTLLFRGGYKTLGVTDQRFHGYMAGVSMEIPLFSRAQAERSAAHAEEKKARARKRLLERQLRAKYRSLSAEFATLRKVSAEYHRRGLQRAEDLVDTAEASYEAGEADIGELLDAYGGVYDATVRAVELAHETRMVHIELQRLLGTSR